MRIISGVARGKRLASFKGKDIRPTTDRVREAIFSILYSRLGSFNSMRVLDLFSGTGAMGLEALSRGAKEAIMVDQGAQAAKVIPKNIRTCQLEQKANFIKSDVLKALSNLNGSDSFDLIFLDPPYAKDLVGKVVALISDLKLLSPGGIICAEAAREDHVSDNIGEFVLIDSRYYGSTAVLFFSYPDFEA